MTLRRDGSIHVKIRNLGDSDITIVDVSGVIDTGTTLILDERLSALLRENRFKLIVNLAGVTYVSSAGWGLFISMLQKTREHNGDIKLVSLNQEVASVFNMLAFSNLISSYPTEKEALAAFKKS